MVDWFPFLPPFFGVLTAFGLDRIVEWIRKYLNRRKLLRELHEELIDIKNRLNGSASLLYPRIWQSAISSGDFRLLNSEQIRKLKAVYNYIEGTEVEATRVRDLAEDFRRAPSGIMDLNDGRTRVEDEEEKWHKKMLEKLWIDYSNVHAKRELELLGNINEILKEKWWDCPKKE